MVGVRSGRRGIRKIDENGYERGCARRAMAMPDEN